MQYLLDRIGRGFEQGRIEFAAPDGRTWTLGQGEPVAHVHLRDAGVLRHLLIHPALHFGEAYMNGLWTPADGDLRPVLRIAVRLAAHLGRRAPALRRLLAYREEFNTPASSRRNAAHHYDIDFELYRRFLDEDLHYSCAYFAEDGMTLEQAQQAKCAHIARKLDLRPGARVLDIGCGWGSLALYLAQHHGAHVTGITLSQAQLEIARQRAQARGLGACVDFRLEDYRQTRGQFDAIISVGMFEHVGRPQYRRFFTQIAQLLAPDGTAVLHTIGRRSPSGGMNPWIRKYIFPGGYIPAASEVLAAIEPSGLVVADLEIWRRHYAYTLAEWHRRFAARAHELPARFDDRFRRMWSFYLLASEANFIEGELVVFQFQLCRRVDRLPLTRDYLYRLDAAQVR
ncbi:cyclopropane-fatty-acyl-phospholipid synthase [Fontimonas thermophila]|uniref:Cyclopropane-fatty-acyl-phospholipid synthase n=1 Tax=Fontimonas thermophila TaxID=1076937 RepID=A0A1I2H6D1_9GAMM|nr:cyclopropane-fatty-acyl-phospholipid synthase family protein [Fontimonas thermophila]SFF25744.1 cyclopropane-fatty-acyl-phospholipid synthase [Fontimonas thermophila]